MATSIIFQDTNGILYKFNTTTLDVGVMFGGWTTASITNTDYIMISSKNQNAKISQISSFGGFIYMSSTNIRYIVGCVQTLYYFDYGSSTSYSTFGQLPINSISGYSALSTMTRSIFSGGSVSSTKQTMIEYVTPSTLSNSTTFGSLSEARSVLASFSSKTRGVIGDGQGASPLSSIEYVTISTTSNSSPFGSDVAVRYCAGCSNSTYGLFLGGYTGSTNLASIRKLTIATQSNSESWSGLTSARREFSAFSSKTICMTDGGYGTDYNINSIDYVYYGSGSYMTNFGYSSVVRANSGASSNTHGGL